MNDVEETYEWQSMSQEMSIQVSSKEEAWITPPELVSLVKQVLKVIDLDPASSKEANNYIKANKFFTKEDDALVQEWKCENFFMNPPYGKINNKSKAGVFCEKALKEFSVGNVQKGGIILVHGRIGYEWQNHLLDTLDSVILRERLSFVNPHTMKAGNKAKTCQVLHLVGSTYREEFFKTFAPLGYTIERK